MEDKTVVQQLEEIKTELETKSTDLETAQADLAVSLELAQANEERATEAIQKVAELDELSTQLQEQLTEAESEGDTLKEEIKALHSNLDLTAYDDVSEGAESVEEVAEAADKNIVDQWLAIRGTPDGLAFWRENKKAIYKAVEQSK